MALRRIVAAGFLGAVLLLSTSPPVTAASGPEIDWFMLTVTGGPTGSRDVQTVILASGEISATGPLVLGTGYASRYGNGVFATPAVSGETAVTTSRALGGQRLVVQQSQSGRLTATSVGSLGDLGFGESVTILQAFSHARMRVRSVVVDPASGSVTTKLTQGTGTRALVLADPAGEGPSVNAGVGGAGAPSYKAVLGSGAVGAFTSCGACSASWKAPGSLGGSYTQTPLTSTSPSFAGPAGAWAWDWTGAATTSNGPTSIGLVAPIGDAWTRFRPRTAP